VVFLICVSVTAFDPSSVGFADTFSRKGRRGAHVRSVNGLKATSQRFPSGSAK
jgi:hypothetical protein